MKRLFDFTISFLTLILLSFPMLCIAVVVRLSSPGPALYWSDRIGLGNKSFLMPKFRTMRVDTPPIATHLVTNPGKYLTPVGSFLRKTSLDELPQLLSILFGDMSFVGPRPALFNQADLISLRTAKGIHLVTPGLTGWAQVNGRDELPIPVKVDFDWYYTQHRTFMFDLRILALTAWHALMGKGVSH